MNILLYVTTLLMLLSILTYARLENFKALIGIQTGFVYYMGSIEHQMISDSASIWYEKLKPGTKNSGEAAERNNKACSRLSVHLFLKADERNKYPAEYKQTRELLKQLMADLFSKAKFYEEIVATRPNFRDEILDEIQRAIEALPKDKKVASPGELLNLEFTSNELHLAFYEMMNGMPKESLIEVVGPIISPKTVIVGSDSDSEEDTDESSNETDEVHAPPGNVSLLDFLTARPVLQVRVFLAPRPLLLAIYKDATIVDQVIEKRQELYNRVRNKKPGDDVKTLEQEFKASFGQMGHASEYAQILDFSVSNTNPSKYQ